jgi:hypothetical protein
MRWSSSPKRWGKPATYKIHRPIEEERIVEQHRQEQNTEQAIKVRQVTDVHANWSAQERGEHGKFSYQLILDDGAAEYVLRVTADDAKVLRDWFHDADTTYFDMEREVLIFGKIN